MSHYYTRWCETHGDWDDDVDQPEEGCPTCIKEGLFKTRAQLEAELAAARAALRTVRPFRAGYKEWLKEHQAAILAAGGGKR